jgi:hypothetical protein
VSYSLARSGPTATYELSRSTDTDTVTPRRSCSVSIASVFSVAFLGPQRAACLDTKPHDAGFSARFRVTSQMRADRGVGGGACQSRQLQP